jgi:hypothetical protein
VLLAQLTDVLSRRAATVQLVRIEHTAPSVLADYLEAAELLDPEPLLPPPATPTTKTSISCLRRPL